MNLVQLGTAELMSKQVPALTNQIHVWVLRSMTLQDPRQILSIYLGLAPAQIRLEKTGEGKPRIVPEQNPNKISFNRSHSVSFDIIAVTRVGEIGVDIERVRPLEKLDALLKRFAFPSERKRISALAESARVDAFFELWTAKEAWCKAHAKSILHALARYEWDPADAGFSPLFIEAGYKGHLYVIARANEASQTTS